jgi:CRP-like cAMP-binding protein
MMSVDSLANLPIFQGMSAAEREEVMALGRPVQVAAGEHVITQGKMFRNLWFIRSGECEVTRRTDKGCQLNLAKLGPNAQFGEMSFFHPAPHSADVIALTDLELVRLAHQDYQALLDAGNPVAYKIAFNSLKQLAERLRRTDEWVTNLVCDEQHQPTPSEWASFSEILFRGE